MESRHQDAGSPLDMGKQLLARATKVTLSPPADSSCAGLELVNMEEDCSYKCQSSNTHLSVNTDKYILMPFASCSLINNLSLWCSRVNPSTKSGSVYLAPFRSACAPCT